MTTPPADALPETPRPTLAQIALLFLRLGVTAFGGPAAHIALMEHEVVQRRGWLKRDRFLDLLGATHLIPGPNSTEMAIHIGLLAGWAGLLVAGVCFILPAAILTTVFAWAYVEYRSLPEMAGVLYGVKPVLIAIVAQALWRLGKESLKTPLGCLVGAAVAALAFLSVHELLLLFGAGTAMAVLAGLPARRDASAVGAPGVALGLSPLLASTAAPAVVFGLWPLFFVFVKIGSVLYGSGYVLLAFLRSELVERLGWLSEAELLDAVAVGQVTPGPLFTTATFIGYILADRFGEQGLAGALAATVGIFLPAFVFVALSGPLIPLLRRSATAARFLNGVVVASLALMAVVTYELGVAAIVDATTVALAAASAVALLWFRVNATWLVLAGALAGWLSSI